MLPSLAPPAELVRERKDERLALAGELHDEVLPSLFKVHLMGQVLRQDLAAGKLLELDDDLPELLLATEAAQRAIRDLLGDLRRSPLGASGLIPTLRLLVDQLASAGAPPVTLDVEQFESSPLAQLLAYQAIREALHNAAKHARASSIEVRLWKDEALLRLSVTDDGTGFSWAAVDGSRHFGLQIMKERFRGSRWRHVRRFSPGCGNFGGRQCSEGCLKMKTEKGPRRAPSKPVGSGFSLASERRQPERQPAVSRARLRSVARPSCRSPLSSNGPIGAVPPLTYTHPPFGGLRTRIWA